MSDRAFSRQLATIVSIDAAGFSRLMGIDDEAAIAAFEERRELIRDSCASRGGVVFGAAGDSLMADFGSPIDALLAALDFQEKLGKLNAGCGETARMAFRVGINTGHVVIRDAVRYGDDVNIAARLQEIAPEGGVVVSDTTWQHVRERSTARFADLGVQEFHNILLPVRAFRVEPGEAAGAGPPAAGNGAEKHFAFFRADGKGGPPAIAVLPFRHETPELEYMADGIAEDIILGLSNTRWLPVIARNSSFEFRDEKLGAGAAGRALGARYVVSGALARRGEQLRLTIMLDDVSTNRVVLNRRFDQDIAGINAMQDEIGAEIVALLEKEVDRVEQVRTFRVPWESLESWQLVRRGRWHMQRRTHEDTELAYEFFKKAFEREPNSSSTLNELGWWHFWRAWLRFGASDDFKADLDIVADLAKRALFVDSQDARPHAHLGITDIMRGRPRPALGHLEEALRINPSFAFARSAKGSAHMLAGETAKAIPFFLGADRLSPFDLYRFHNLGELASAYSLAKRYEDAVETADRSLSLAPAYWYSRLIKIGALARLGRHQEAIAERAQFYARHPDFSLKRVELIPFLDKSRNGFLIDGFEMAR